MLTRTSAILRKVAEKVRVEDRQLSTKLQRLAQISPELPPDEELSGGYMEVETVSEWINKLKKMLDEIESLRGTTAEHWQQAQPTPEEQDSFMEVEDIISGLLEHYKGMPTTDTLPLDYE